MLPVGGLAQVPEGARVVSGEIAIEQAGPDMTVRQSTDAGIIDWNTFNVGNGFGVHFDNGKGATLNRVTGPDGSFIDGSLTATGSLFLLNRNGVIIGENGRVHTGGNFVASTLDITNEDFLNGGAYTLIGNGSGEVLNLGKISSTGGDVLLAGYTVRNEGAISADSGRVGLLAGTQIDVLTDISWLGGAYAVSLGARENNVTNLGRIEAMIAELRTHNGNIYALAGNNDGLIQATGVATEGGRVVLTAENGLVESSGTIIATKGENGGSIEIAASEVHNFGGLQDVSGATGGSIQITTDSLIADTEMRADGHTGNGGSIVIDADGQTLLTSAGVISADGATTGGRVVIGSGSGALIDSATISADGGETGGHVVLVGSDVALLAGQVSAEGGTQGGRVEVGGGYQGGAIWAAGSAPLNYTNANSVYVSNRSKLSADSTVAGDGGQVILWSDGTTQFYGELSAREGAAGGMGGLIETSGLQGLGGDGLVDAGQGGTWLQDPRNIIIDGSTDAVTEFQRLISPVAAGSQTADREAQNYASGIGLNFGSAIDIDGDTFVIGGYREGVSTSFPDMGVYVFENGSVAARLSSTKGATDQTGLGDVAVVGDYVAFSTNQSIFDGTTYNGLVHFFYKGDGWQNGTSNLFSETHGYATSSQATVDDYKNGKLVGFKSPGSESGSAEFALALPTADSGSLVDAGLVSFFRVNPNGGNPSVSLGAIVAGDAANQQAGYYITASDDMVFMGYHYTSSLSNVLRYGDSGYTLNTKTMNTATAWSMAAAASGSLAAGDLTLALRTSDQFNIFELENESGSLSIKEEGTFQSPNFAGSMKDIAYSGDTLLVGAPFANNFGGGALFFREPAAGWGSLTASGSTYTPELVINGNGSYQPAGYQTYNGQLGAAVALDGNTALLGMPTWHGGVFTSSGAGAYDAAVGEVRMVARNPDGSWTNAYQIGLRPASAITPTDTTSSFGQAVAIDGTTYAVSDSFRRVADVDVGAVYLYENGALAATILGGQGGFGNSFGTKLDLSGGTLAIGRGSSVILVERDAGWRNLGGGIVYSPSPNPLSFVSGVSDFSLEGNFLAVGNSSAGEVSIYENTVNSWATTVAGAKTTVSRPTEAESSFGTGVAFSGNSLAVYDGSYPGNVFMFENLLNDWATATSTQLIRTGSLADDHLGFAGRFGGSLSLDGDTLAVGFGVGSTTVEHPNTRGAYVYERDTTWADAATPVARLTAPGGEDFGALVAVDDDMIVVTESWRISSSVNQGGDTAYVFQRQGGWREGDANLVASLATSYGGGLQYGVAIDNGNILIGGEDLLYTAFNESVSVFTGPFLINQRAAFGVNDGTDLRLSAGMIANSLSFGTNITLQANNDISVLSPIIVDNPSGDGGNLTFEAGRSILVNAGITTDGGDLILLANSSNANATYTSSGEAVVVLGENVELNLGTGDLLINAADRFENRSGDTSPFVFDATTPGSWLIYAATPDNTGAPELANLGNDLDLFGRDYLYYGLSFDPSTPRPSSLPSGNGFVYAVQPSITVGVGDSTITYGQTPSATLSLEGVTVDDSAVDAAQFGINQSDLVNLVDVGVASSVPLSSSGFANAGSHPGGVSAVARTTVTTGGVYGVAVTTGEAGDLTVNQATLNVLPDDSTRVYRASDPTFTVTYTGFATGDDAADLDTPVSVTSAANEASPVGGYTITATGGLDTNYIFNFTGTGLLTITPADLAITGVSAEDRVYDATTNANITGTPTIAVDPGDDVVLTGTLTATATFTDPNAGIGIPVVFTGFGLSGSSAGNYNLILPTSVTAAINPYSLTLDEVAVADKVYDTTTEATLTSTPSIAPLPGDVVVLTGLATAEFEDENAGESKNVNVSGLALAGDDAGNYVLSTTAIVTAAIRPREVEVTGVNARDRVYDATTVATLTGTPAVTPLAGDSLEVTGTAIANFDSKNAGTGIGVSVTGYTLSGADALNYILNQPSGMTADILRANLLITGITAENRVYDATTIANLIGMVTLDPLGSDQVEVTGTGVGTFADKNVGSGKAVTVTGFSLSGIDADNYNLLPLVGLTADVTARPISVSGVSVEDKVYDGTTVATTVGAGTFTGVLEGDSATIDASAVSFLYRDRHVGIDKTIMLSGVTISGTDAANYDASQAVGLVANITPATLIVVGASAADRVYDSTATVAVSCGSLSGVIGTDAVNFDATGSTGTLSDKNIGTDKSVAASGYVVTGIDASNYQLVQPAGLTATITPFALNLVGLNGDKTYDGTTSAFLSYAGLDAVFGGDLVSVDDSAVSAAYADKTAGTDKAITLAGLFALSGFDALNYLLYQPSALSGTIARRGITVSGLTIADKTYDGTTVGSIAGTGTFGGTIAGDDLEIDVGVITVSFGDKHAGVDKAVSLSGVSLTGADADNYTAATPTGISATIFAKDLNLTGVNAENKVYDRTATATLAGVGALQGTITGDAISIDETARAGAFSDKNVGVGKSVSVSGVVLTGADATNYNLVAPSLSADISAAQVDVVGLTAVDRVYDSTTVVTFNDSATLDFGALTGVLESSEEVQLQGAATGQFADKNVGSNKAVTVSDLSLTGSDASNYDLNLPTGLTASVSAAELQITGTSIADRVYDSTLLAQIMESGRVTALGIDVVVLGGTLSAEFADKNVGEDKAVSVTGYSLSGTDAANYTISLPVNVTANVTPAELALADLTADDKTYDGTNSAPLGGTLDVTALGADVVTVAGRPTAVFADKNVGSDKSVTVSGLSLTGTDAANYQLTIPSLVANIVKRVVSVLGLTGTDRIYDGSTGVVLAGLGTLSNTVSGDDLSFDRSAVTGAFADKNVGQNKGITLSGNGLVGTDSGNYEQTLPVDLTATVSAKDVVINGVQAEDRDYDATRVVALSGGSLEGVILGDDLQLNTTSAEGLVADKNVGVDKLVTTTGYRVAGADAGNYAVAQPTDVTVDISPLELSVTGIEIADKFFDGTTTATPSGGALQGIISGDDLNLDRTAVTADFDTAAVGQDKAVAVAGLALGGTDAGNYTLPATLPSEGNILQTLETITDVVPVEVLQATAAEARESERAALRAIADAAENAVSPVDYESQTADLVSGLPPLNINPAMRNLDFGYSDPQVDEYLAAADEAQSTRSSYLIQAESLRQTTRKFKELAQSLNAATRDAEVAQGLVETLQTQIATVNNEIATLEQNLASIEVAKKSVTDLKQKIAEANRLGRGAEVAQYQAMLAEAEAIVDAEAKTRAALDTLQTERADSESRLAANSETIARAAALKSAYEATQDSVLAQKTSVTAAKSAAEAAATKLEAARAKGEESARGEIEGVERMIAVYKDRITSDVAAMVEEQYGDLSLDKLIDTGVRLSPEQQAERETAYHQPSSDMKTWQALKSKEDAAIEKVNSIPYSTRRHWEEAARKSWALKLTSEEIATMDLRSLGLRDEQLLQDATPPLLNLVDATDTLAEALQKVGPIKNAIVGEITIDLSDKIDPRSRRGITDIDTPLTFDGGTEFALKMELQNVGILPRFQNQALADLPVSQQLQLKSAMEATAQRQQDLIAGGMSPDEAAKEAMDEKTMELVTMALFEKFDTYGVGNIPGAQEFVGTALGELSAQFGVDPGGMAINLANGDFGKFLGSADDALNAVTERYVEVVTNPVGAGVQLASDIGNAAKAGGEAFVKAWIGGGGGSSTDEAEQAKVAFEARQKELNVLSSALLQVETRRQEAVVARGLALNQVRTMLVTQAEGEEARVERSAMGNYETLEAARDEAAAAKLKELYLEALVEQKTPLIEASNQKNAQSMANQEANLANPKAKLEAFTGGGK